MVCEHTNKILAYSVISRSNICIKAITDENDRYYMLTEVKCIKQNETHFTLYMAHCTVDRPYSVFTLECPFQLGNIETLKMRLNQENWIYQIFLPHLWDWVGSDLGQFRHPLCKYSFIAKDEHFVSQQCLDMVHSQVNCLAGTASQRIYFPP